MIHSRNRNIVVKSQFNINGSRGRDAGKFISDYVSRETATDPSQAYRPDPNQIPQTGDGVAFTLDSTAITRRETLQIAEHVQTLHETGKRAIQQLVVSLAPEYLIQEKLVPARIEVLRKGDYRYQYDDVRLRHAVRRGLQAMVDSEGYRDGKAVACIQWDTRHLHIHAVVYEDAAKIARWHGHEEKGLIKASSFNQLAHEIDRHLELTKMPGLIPTAKSLFPQPLETPEKPAMTTAPQAADPMPEPTYVKAYLLILQQQKQQEMAAKAKQLAHQLIDRDGQLHDVPKAAPPAIERHQPTPESDHLNLE